MDAGEYVYCGRIELVDKPYIETQSSADGVPRKVWMFPIRTMPDNDVKKSAMFVFKDMEEFNARGKDVDEQYMKMIAAKKSRQQICVCSTSYSKARTKATSCYSC